MRWWGVGAGWRGMRDGSFPLCLSTFFINFVVWIAVACSLAGIWGVYTLRKLSELHDYRKWLVCVRSMSYIYTLNYNNVGGVALHDAKEFRTNCYWTGYLFMGDIICQQKELIVSSEWVSPFQLSGWGATEREKIPKYLLDSGLPGSAPHPVSAMPLILLGNTSGNFSLGWKKRVIGKTCPGLPAYLGGKKKS